jgi:transposase-like protein
MDESYVKVKGRWMYQCRAVDKHGKTLDFMLSEQRDEAAAEAFFKKGRRQQWCAGEGSDRQKRCQSGRPVEPQPPPVFPWLLAAH